MKQSHFYQLALILILMPIVFTCNGQYNKQFQGTYSLLINDTISTDSTKFIKVLSLLPDTGHNKTQVLFAGDDTIGNGILDTLTSTIWFIPYKISAGGGHSIGNPTPCTYTITHDTINLSWQIWDFVNNTWTQCNGCGPYYYTYVRIYNPTSINSITSPHQMLKFWPNPVLDKLYFTIATLTKDINISVYNTLGQLVYQEKDRTNSETHYINTSLFIKGLYIVKVTDDTSSFTNKFIKE